MDREKNCLSKNFTTDQTPEMFLSQLSYVKKFPAEMKHIHEIKPSRYHLNHVLSPYPRPRCWIPRVQIHFRNLGRSPHCQMLFRSRGPTQHLGTRAGSPSQSLRSGSAQTAGIRCPTVRSLRACASWPAGRCPNPHRSGISGTAGAAGLAAGLVLVLVRVALRGGTLLPPLALIRVAVAVAVAGMPFISNFQFIFIRRIIT